MFKNIKFNRRFSLYVALFATLLAVAYFKIQEESNLNKEGSFEIPEVVKGNKVVTNTSKSIVTDPQVIAESSYSVDLFAVYKKPIVETKPVEVVHQSKVNSPSPAVVSIQTPINPVQAVQIIPLKYLGKIWGDGEYQVFIIFNGRNLVVKEGDEIQQTYKVEKISPPIMELTYLPTGVTQTLPIGEPS